MAGNKEESFSADSFRISGFSENHGFILITGITESNIDSAVKISESARAEGIVTAGIFSGSENMERLYDSIYGRCNTLRR